MTAAETRRAEAFAVLDKLDAEYHGLDFHPQMSRRIRMLAALRSVLERHQPRGGFTASPLLPGEDYCQWCERTSPCPDETAVIDALLGVAR